MPRVLRLFRFKPATPQFDETVRATLLPDLGRLPGLLDLAAGRRVSLADDDRVIASIWRSWSAMQDAVGASVEESPFHPELLDGSTNRKFSATPIVFAKLQHLVPSGLRNRRRFYHLAGWLLGWRRKW